MTEDRRTQFHQIAHGQGNQAWLTSAWQHHIGHEYGAENFAAATLDFVRKWDWDWVKINPRAIYYAEVWDAVYDKDHYDWLIPRTVRQLSTLSSPRSRSSFCWLIFPSIPMSRALCKRATGI